MIGTKKHMEGNRMKFYFFLILILMSSILLLSCAKQALLINRSGNDVVVCHENIISVLHDECDYILFPFPGRKYTDEKLYIKEVPSDGITLGVCPETRSFTTTNMAEMIHNIKDYDNKHGSTGTYIFDSDGNLRLIQYDTTPRFYHYDENRGRYCQ